MLNNVHELTQEIHATAKAKGWWEKPRKFNDLLMLVFTEIAEATEELRKGTPLVYVNCASKVLEITADMPLEMFMLTDCESGLKTMMKPEGEVIELADAAIRLMDMAGSYGIDLSNVVRTAVVDDQSNDLFSASMLSGHLAIIASSILYMDQSENAAIIVAFGAIVSYCLFKNLPLQRAIEIKMAYNKTREYRHGGKLL